MSLVFTNQTDFDALRFDQIDPLGEPYHVFVMRIAYDLVPGPSGRVRLQAVDEPALLIEEDQYLGEMNQSSVRCESDLAPYKPRCDVIVNATAHAPGGKAVRNFEVALRVRRPDSRAPLPRPPQPLNPYMPVGQEEKAAWQAKLAAARRTMLPGRVLIDKTLRVTGPRRFKKKFLFTRLFQGILRWGSLGLLRPNPWRLSRPGKITAQPLSYEIAWGGQARINQRDNSHWASDPKAARRWQNAPRPAKRLKRANRLTAEQLALHPDTAMPAALLPVAHSVCETNPLGRGHAPMWYLKASRRKTMPAPQIEYPHAPLTAEQFWRAARGKTDPEPAGFGCLGRAWQPRRRLIGAIEDKEDWAEDEYPQLPEDFDHGYWNCAPRDQQCPHLIGDEIFELTNLSPPTQFGATDGEGNRHLAFQLPGTRPYLMLADGEGNRGAKLMDLDTVYIEPETGRVELVWRSIVTARAELVEAQTLIAEHTVDRQALKDLLPPQQRAEIEAEAEAEVMHGA